MAGIGAMRLGRTGWGSEAACKSAGVGWVEMYDGGEQVRGRMK